MKLITFQNFIIFNALTRDNDYHCNHISFTHNRTKGCYDRLSAELRKTSDIQFNNPVFAWRYDYKNNISLSHIRRVFNRCVIENANIAMILDVPSKDVSLSNFYNFCDVMSEEQGDDIYDWAKDGRYDSHEQFMRTSWKLVFDFNPNEIHQAIIPCIKQDWITSISLIDKSGQIIKHNIDLCDLQ